MKVYCPKHYKYGTLKFKLIDEAELERYLAEGWDVLPSGRIIDKEGRLNFICMTYHI